MRKSKLMVMSGLLAVVALLLVAVPAYAAEGKETSRGDGAEKLMVTVLSEGAGFASTFKDGLGSNTELRDLRGTGGDSVIVDLADPDGDASEDDSEEDNARGLSDDRGPTKLGRDLYVSNQRPENGSLAAADMRTYNTLWIRMAWGTASGGKITVSSPSGDNVTLNRGDAEHGAGENPEVSHLFVQVIKPVDTGSVPPGAIEAEDGDVVSVSAGTIDVDVIVDGEGPTFSNVRPDDGDLTSKSSVTVAFTVTDEGSGLRTDRSDDGEDGDGVSAEPLSAEDGSAVDIVLNWPRSDSDNDTKRGDNDWVEEDRDNSYSVSYSRRGLESDTIEWSLKAYDRVRNMSELDRDPDKADVQYYRLTVDSDGPDATEDVYAGIGFDEDEGDEGGEVRDNKSIMLLFKDPNGVDPLDGSTVEVSDFRVEGNTVVGVVHPNMKMSKDDDDECESHTGIVEDKTGDKCIDTRNRVYLMLEDALDDDETPEVSIVGTVEDKAGNDNVDLDEVEAQDKIAPTVELTITGDVETDGRPLATETITVRVSTGERLRRAPNVYVAKLKLAVASDGAMTYTVGDLIDNGNVSSKGTNTWEREFDLDEETTLAAVLYFAEDREDNMTFSSGWKGDDSSSPGNTPGGDKLDFGKLVSGGLLVQYDGLFAGDGKLKASIDPDTDDEDNDLETESSSPFIVLDFSVLDDGKGSETQENGLTAGGKTYHEGEDSDGQTVKFDAYGEVMIDSVMLGGEDVSAGLVADGTAKYNLSLSGLPVGSHTLVVQASDTAENAKEFKVNFEVLKRSAYRVDLRPGWNLVSLPANPADMTLGSVLPESASQALSYQDGEWITAAWDAESEMWVGTLTEMMAGYGYWVETNVFTRIEAQLPEAQPTSVLPTVSVVQGWNLLGIVDFQQRKAGMEHEKADDYFSSIEWSLAYSFDTQRGRWTKLTEGDTMAMVKTGTGYWVWVTKAGTLVP